MSPTENGKQAAQIVLSALDDLNQSEICPNGVSARELTNLLSSEYKLPTKYRRHIRTALDNGVKFGAIEKKKTKYFLGDVFPGIRQVKRRRRSKSQSKGRSSRSKSKKGKKSRRRRRALLAIV